MKRTYRLVIFASALGLSSLAHAGTTGDMMSRAQKRAQLIAAELAGQYPQSDSHYPDAAPDQAITHVAQRDAAREGISGAYGADMNGGVSAGSIGERRTSDADAPLGLGQMYMGS